ncbi:MAG: primosomal protein N' [Rectinemataceae bacterium]|nr:primosomal protein N' [Rectinemataceae bacterium]
MAEFLKVAFNIPLRNLFTYRNLPDTPAGIGCRVEAPFGRRKATGYVVEELGASDIDPESVKSILKRVDSEALFTEGTLALARWLSGMYLCSLGEALAAMIPSGKRETEAPALDAGGEGIGDHALEPTVEQQDALARITRSESGTTYVFGLTGSGKTEVFMQAAESALAGGRGVIYLVPEIALTGQVVAAAAKRFGPRCAVLHSRLTPSRRLAEWRRILRGEARVVIGARSAVFAPVSGLGLIIIDEEHEGSYKAGNAPRYHARQVAMKRAAVEGARLVMGSATPSVESWHLAATGAMERVRLTTRPAGGSLPAVEIVDMNGEDGPISGRLAEAVRETKERGGQSILFLNRRGFSWFFRCNTCGAEIRCRHCSVALTYHKERGSLECHYCGYRMRPPTSCPTCSSLDVGWAGFGTERIEEDARKLFPGFAISRLDADTTSRKGELEKALDDFRQGRVDILLGTQMVAKGLNFPKVKTIGVILADTTLNLPDFRAAERAFALIVQVAGRAGRFTPDGRVFVQTYRPDNEVIRLAAAMDTERFYQRELEQRSMLGFPPFSRLVRVVFRSHDPGKGERAAAGFAAAIAPGLPGDVEILGPAECPVGMIAGNARCQLLFRAPSLARLHPVLAAVAASFVPPNGVYIETDIDPVNLM